jgi:hypothetical protein
MASTVCLSGELATSFDSLVRVCADEGNVAVVG